MLAESIQRTYTPTQIQSVQESISKEMLMNIVQHLTDQSQKRERELVAENDRLKREQSQLHERNNHLEANQDDLLNEVEDLRRLVKRVYDEGEIQLQKTQTRNQLQQLQLDNVSKAYSNLLVNFPSMSNGWTQLLQDGELHSYKSSC